MKNVFVRPAAAVDNGLFLDWSQATQGNLFDPEVVSYGSTFTLCAPPPNCPADAAAAASAATVTVLLLLSPAPLPCYCCYYYFCCPPAPMRVRCRQGRQVPCLLPLSHDLMIPPSPAAAPGRGARARRVA